MLRTTIKYTFLATMLVLIAFQGTSLHTQFTRKQMLEQQLAQALKLEQALQARQQAEREQAHARALAQWEQARKDRERALKQRRVYAIESEGAANSTTKQVIEEPLPPLPPPPPPPPPTVIEASLSDGIRVELQNDTSWQTILQLVFTVLATYLGLKLINKYVSKSRTT